MTPANETDILKRALYTNRREGWWFHTIRSLNLFAYRYWWLVLFLFLTLLLLWFEFCFFCKKERIPYVPTENCRVHFSGIFMCGKNEGNNGTKIYELDNFSEFVGFGEYPSNEVAFPKAVRSSFDGIAIDKGTRLIIYEKGNFQGRIVLDVTGPALIYNVLWENDSRYNFMIDEVFPEPLQSNYPRSVRTYSSEDMHPWSLGSCKIICE
jgi:hypothetical protein